VKFLDDVAYPKFQTLFLSRLILCGVVSIVCLTTVTSCTNEMKTPQISETSSLEFQSHTSRFDSRAITNNAAFEQTLHPILLANCSDCHGINSVTPPRVGHTNLDIVTNDISQKQLIDKRSPENSSLVFKLSKLLHHCWTTCEEDAITVTNAIKDWLSLLIAEGKAFYIELCAGCHGLDGKGTLDGPAFVLPLIENQLITAIETTMPPTLPTTCNADCAIEVTRYMMDTFNQPLPIRSTDSPLAMLPKGNLQNSNLCAELANINRTDIINDVFCTALPPMVTSLGNLLELIELSFTDIYTAHVFTGHSTSLAARSVSAINPRAIIFPHPRNPNKTPNITAISFSRGEQFVEIVTIDRITQELFFYLLEFEKPCNKGNSCTNADLLTREVEINWTDYTIYSQTDIKNTIFDCLQCHQPEGPGTTSILRMQETNYPWTHFFSTGTIGGEDLVWDYIAAHTVRNIYASIKGGIASSRPENLELFITEISGLTEAPTPGPTLPPSNGITIQPNQFDSYTIENEVKLSNPQQPDINVPPGKSATWDSIYEASVRGEFISVPYHDVKVTDPIKLGAMQKSYLNFFKGLLAPEDLPDIRDVFLDSKLAEIGFKVKPGLDGAGIITHACTQCHNSKLDQTISRARFNVDLTMMSDTQGGVLTGTERDKEIEVAISRLQLANTDVKVMPPILLKFLDPKEIDLAIQYLCSQATGNLISCQ